MRLTTLPPSCAVVMKSGNLNLLEPSGPLQACNGTALTFTTFTKHEYSDFSLQFRTVFFHLNIFTIILAIIELI